MRMRSIYLYCLLLLLLFLPGLAHTKIIFKISGKGLYMMDDDGDNVQRITTYAASWPVWSPDGKQIAYDKSITKNPKDGQQIAVFIMNSDGSNERRLTDDIAADLVSGRIFEGNPSWSPDGHYIVFSTIRDYKRGTAGTEIYTMELATKKMRRLTRKDSLKTFPSWSPDGKYIVYEDGFTIYLMRSDGSGQRALVRDDGFHARYAPRWSTDSQSVVYGEHKYNQQGFVSEKLVIHNIETDKRQIVQTPDDWDLHVGACFMGSKYLLIAARGLNDNPPDEYEIYRYHLVTEEIVNLTNSPGKADYLMNWISDDVLPVSPRGKKKVTWGQLRSETLQYEKMDNGQ